ncbi:MAG: 5'/3'-nucleotidase SurE [Phyllobacteriaceae bacterium]|nr:5'/3'-nucleotidase SurE [Phyllobacteriaceae bacterium]MBA89662.1 5'/3'-nucleotidase SurE [Phyllobacteriaceae bacterium]
MRILLTNDDGIHDEGIAVLERIARQLSDDVWVVAPETDQSGLAHSLTLSHPLRLRKLDDRHFAVRGTPTDCVIMAVRHIMPEAPDLILSGVNSGTNIADDVTYSGTVAGAMEGTLVGIRSIALSQGYNFSDEGRVVPYEVAETHAVDVLRKCLATDLPEGTLLNVNFPNCKPDEVKGVAVTTQGRIVHGVGVEERRDGRNFPYFWIRFARKEFDAVEGTDIAALRDDYISITPLKLNLTAHEAQDALRSAF